MTIKIQHRRGTAAQWVTANPILAAGEMGVETDTLKAKMGDGSTAWNSLGYMAAGFFGSNGKLATGTVPTAALDDSAVTTEKIATNAVTADKIAADAVGTSEIAANAVGASELADNAVDTAAIQDNAVTADKIAANAVGASELANNAVDTAAIADGAVTAAKIDATAWASKADTSAVDTLKAGIGNLLTANQAKPTTTGAYVVFNATEGAPGVFTLTAGEAIARVLNIPVQAGQTYTAIATLTVPDRYVRVLVLWKDAAGDAIGALAGSGAPFDVPVNSTGTVAIAVVAPDNAVTADFYPFYTSAGAADDPLTITHASFHAGAGGTWQPPNVPIPHTGILPTQQSPVPQAKLWAGNGWAPLATLIGTGSPLNVVTPDFKGQEYVDVNQTLGARKWVATSTASSGWKVSDGETPWYNVTARLVNGWAAFGGGANLAHGLLVQRQGKTVRWRVGDLTSAAATADGFLASIPGFRPPLAHGINAVVADTTNTLRVIIIDYGAGMSLVRTANPVWDDWEHSTDDPWPTAAPGTPYIP